MWGDPQPSGQRGGAKAADLGLDFLLHGNGYPSGPHFNVNVHGKGETFTCETTEGGNSVFIAEYGESTLEFLTNQKSSVTELTVLDPCAEAFDDNPATVQVPYNAGGHYLFGRIRGKPQNGSNPGDASSLRFVPEPVFKVCNDTTGDPAFGDLTECDDGSLFALGAVTNQGVYDVIGDGFVRWDPAAGSKGKGKSKAIDITDLLKWTGYVCQGTLDTNGPDGVPDGVLDTWDVPLTYDVNPANGVIDQAEFDAWLVHQETLGECTYYPEEWVWNIADMVIYGQPIDNDGVKLLKLRFYPITETTFVDSN